MALPKVFKVLGILPATALLFLVYALTHLSLNLLLRCARSSAAALRGRAKPPWR
jgi:amino acid permease